MRVFPDSERAERPVDGDRNHRQKQPEARQWFDFFDFPQKRIDQKAENQSEIDTEAPRTDRERMILDVKRAPLHLMTDIAEKFITRRRDAFKTVRFRQRREQNRENPCENYE